MAEAMAFDPAGFESAIGNLQKYGETARGDVETTFNRALEDIMNSTREQIALIEELEGGDSTNAAKMVSLVRAPIDDALADVVQAMTDQRQRGGYSGSPRVRSMIESAVRTLTPLAGEKVAEALATKERLGMKKAGVYESEGIQKAGLSSKKGELLTSVGGNVASQIASIEKSREQAKLDENRRMDDLRIGLLQASKPDSVTEFFDKLGMDPNLRNVYAGTPQGKTLESAISGAISPKVSSAPAAGGAPVDTRKDALKEYNQLMAAYGVPATDRLSGANVYGIPGAKSLYKTAFPTKWSY